MSTSVDNGVFNLETAPVAAAHLGKPIQKPSLSNVKPEIQYFDTKEIQWPGQTGAPQPVNILLQNSNGPCPLVALINTMVLTNPATAAYTSGKERISVKGLLEYLGELLLEKVSRSEQSESNEMINDTDDVLRLLPKLVTGLNIDPMFDGQFSNSPEMSLFRLYDVDVVHGWLINPESPNSKHVIEAESYEHSQILLVEASEIEARQAKRKLELSNPKGKSVTNSPVKDELSPSKGSSEASATMKLVENRLSPTESSVADKIAAPEASETSKFQEPSSQPVEVTPAVADSPQAEGGSIPTPPKTFGLPDDERAAEDNLLLTKVRAVKTFLSQYPTQLTEYGISFLNELLPPGNLAIFFRNDHFSTIYKPHWTDQPLMILVADAGFRRQKDIVWQSLSSVNGQDNFYDGLFQISPYDVAQDPATEAARLSISDDQAVNEALDFEYARQLQEEEDRRIAAAASQTRSRQTRPANQQSQSNSQAASGSNKSRDKCIIS